MDEFVRFFWGEKGVKLKKELEEFLVRKFGEKNYKGIEKLFVSTLFAFFAFFVFPNVIEPIIELAGGDKK